jgi:hypothetical protein
MACPIETSSEFKQLSKQVGRDLAVYTWHAYGEAYPEMQNTSNLRRAVGVPYTAYNDTVWRAAKKVRRYNAQNGTSHYFTRERIGQSDQYRIHFKVNYLPVNLEKQRQRDLDRSEQDKAWFDFHQLDFNEVTPEHIQAKAKKATDLENGVVEDPYKDVYGLNETLPELEVHVLGDGQYEVGGEIYPSYEDALVAVDNDPFDFSAIDEVEVQPVGEQQVDLELQTDIENMYPTPKLLDYLHSVGSGRMSIDNFYKEASSLMSKLKSEGMSNEDIMDAIKCL